MKVQKRRKRTPKRKKATIQVASTTTTAANAVGTVLYYPTHPPRQKTWVTRILDRIFPRTGV